MTNKTQLFSIVGCLAVAVVIVVGLTYLPNEEPSPSSAKTNREVALTCTTDMATEFHIHPTLKIIANGQEQVIPPNIGVTSLCMNPLHTHDAKGTLHVESPEKRDFTLRDFFAVWRKTFTREQVLDFKADETNTITVTVNGLPSQEYENLILRDGDQIVITYGLDS